MCHRGLCGAPAPICAQISPPRKRSVCPTEPTQSQRPVPADMEIYQGRITKHRNGSSTPNSGIMMHWGLRAVPAHQSGVVRDRNATIEIIKWRGQDAFGLAIKTSFRCSRQKMRPGRVERVAQASGGEIHHPDRRASRQVCDVGQQAHEMGCYGHGSRDP